MKFCEYADQIPCLTNDYNKFDSTCSKELISPISVHEIINESDFCISLAIDIIEEHQDDLLTVNEHLAGLKDKNGLYHLWVDHSHCTDHEVHSMICVYVGKGIVLDRIKDHLKTKWPKEEMIHISFYECENRISKYLEQLFLDTYNYHLNKSENTGIGTLYARWEDERYDIGTELQSMADIYDKNNPGLGG